MRRLRGQALLAGGLGAAVAAVIVGLGQEAHDAIVERAQSLPVVEGFGAQEWRVAPALPVVVASELPAASGPTLLMPVDANNAAIDIGPPLPAHLLNFLISRSLAFLESAPGVSVQATGTLPVESARWREVAAALAADPVAAQQVLSWLAAQQQPSAYVALASFWSELVHQGADHELGRGVELAAMPVPALSVLMPSLSRLDAIPNEVLQDFQRRISLGEISYAEVLAAASRAVDADQARMALALGGAAAPLDAVFAVRFADPAAQQAAIDLAADQPDAAVIDRLLSQAQAGNAALATYIAAQWAPRQLSGERLSHLAQLLRAGAFVGAGQSVLVALLANAEDREEAASLAAGAGVALPPPK